MKYKISIMSVNDETQNESTKRPNCRRYRINNDWTTAEVKMKWKFILAFFFIRLITSISTSFYYVRPLAIGHCPLYSGTLYDLILIE